MLVSIIIPAYNAGGFIGDALDSLLAQTDDGWEAIVVDDGSIDDTKEVVTSYCQNDKRIRLISQSNSGPSIARGRGVADCNGEWISFLDADDVLSSDAIAIFNKSVSRGNSDIYVYSHQDGWKYHNITISADDFRKASLLQEYSTGPWCKLYKRCLLTPFVFDMPKWLKSGEDWIMNVRIAFGLTGSVTFCTECVYHCRPEVNGNSLMKTYNTDWNYTNLYFEEFINSIPVEAHSKYANEIVSVLSKVFHNKWRKIWRIKTLERQTTINARLQYFIKLGTNKGAFIERVERNMTNTLMRCMCDLVERCVGVVNRLTKSKKHKYYDEK